MRNHYSRSPFKRKLNNLHIESKNYESTVYIYDEISFWGISAQDFVKELQDIKSGTIHVRLNSPGGSVFDGTAIYNALKQHKAKIIVHIDGLAASIASVIAMAGDEIRIGDGAYMMIHDPWSIVIGTADIMRDEAELLDKVGGTIAGIYKAKTGKDEDELKQMMADETWLTAQESVDHGFATMIDQIDDQKKNQAKNLFDLSVFAKVPEALQTKTGHAPTERDIERALRDVGCSNKQAKTILARGFVDDLRDEDSDPGPQPANSQRDAEADPVKKDRTHALLIAAEEMTTKHAA